MAREVGHRKDFLNTTPNYKYYKNHPNKKTGKLIEGRGELRVYRYYI
jgi:hypothetical protein